MYTGNYSFKMNIIEEIRSCVVILYKELQDELSKCWFVMFFWTSREYRPGMVCRVDILGLIKCRDTESLEAVSCIPLCSKYQISKEVCGTFGTVQWNMGY